LLEAAAFGAFGRGTGSSSLIAGMLAGFDAFVFGVCPLVSLLLPFPMTLGGDMIWELRDVRDDVVDDRSRPIAKIGSDGPVVGVGRVFLRDAARAAGAVSLVDPRREIASFDCELRLL
jgi:hypothetical protein